MKTTAIIAEYNPFHNGHAYQIAQTRKDTGADYIMVVMSGDFVQRGAPAILNKYIRTQMALLGGADIVIELPTLYATSSAEFFAQGAVNLINRLNVADILSFGSESGDATVFTKVASALLSENSENKHYQDTLAALLKQGLSFPAARERAFAELLSDPLLKDELQLFSSPNNILGIEYCKAMLALNSKIQPFTIKRTGNGYHDTALLDDSNCFASASAVRKTLFETSSSDIPEKLQEISAHMPDSVFKLFQNSFLSNIAVSENDFSQLLHYKLLLNEQCGFSDYLDCTSDLSDKIRKNIVNYTDFSSFCDLLKSKDVTYTRLSRTLTHILLDIKTPEFYRSSFSGRSLTMPYARLLGFRQSATPLLSAIKKNSETPLISKMADAHTLLSKDDYTFLLQDIRCASIYESISSKKGNRSPLNEFRQSPIILS